jgi:isopentenyldiphosphate isomerase
MPLDDPTELFTEVDDHDHVLGSILRSVAHNGSNRIHRSCSLLITNSHHQILIQKRSLKKDTNPGFWAEAVGEHVHFGETYLHAAIRGAQEELGFTLKPKLVGKGLFQLEIQREFAAIFRVALDFTPTTFDRTEIETLRWVDLTHLPHFTQTHPCTQGFLQECRLVGYL